MINTYEKEPKVWHFAGIGALGGLLASHFHQEGLKVRLILRNEKRLAEYHSSFLRITSKQFTETSCPEATDIAHLSEAPIHYLVCCVKAYDVLAFLNNIQRHINDKSTIILIHNGLGILEEIQSAQPHLRIIAGLSTIGAYQNAPFSVHSDLNGVIYLGAALGTFAENEIKDVTSAFAMAKIPFRFENDIFPKLWEKFALNCSINLLTTLHSCKNGDLLSQKELLKKMTDEITSVLTAYNVSLTSENLFLKVMHLLQATENNYSSMYQDTKYHRRTELAYLNEHLIKLGIQKNIATPLQRNLVNEFYRRFPPKSYE